MTTPALFPSPQMTLVGPVPDLVPFAAPLAGFSVAVASERRRHALAGLLESAGARTLSAQAVRVVTPGSTAHMQAAIAAVLAYPVHELLVTSYFGIRAWMATAAAQGQAGQLLERLRAARLLASTPRAADGLREFGLTDIWSTAAGQTEELLRYLYAQPLYGRRVVVQADGPNLADGAEHLRRLGAEVIEVPTFDVLEPASAVALRPLTDQVLTHQVDALVVLSAAAGDNIIAQAEREGRVADLGRALASNVAVIVPGKIAAAPFTARGIGVIVADHPYLSEIVAMTCAVVPRRALRVRVDGHRIEVRGQAVVFDNELISIQPGPISVLRALARQPGAVLSVADIRRASPNWAGADDHAIEMAVSRLRRALHNAAVIQTVMKRGYRLPV